MSTKYYASFLVTHSNQPLPRQYCGVVDVPGERHDGPAVEDLRHLFGEEMAVAPQGIRLLHWSRLH